MVESLKSEKLLLKQKKIMDYLIKLPFCLLMKFTDLIKPNRMVFYLMSKMVPLL